MGAISSQSTGGKAVRLHQEAVELLEPPEGVGLVPLRDGVDGAGVGVGQRLIIEATERYVRAGAQQRAGEGLVVFRATRGTEVGLFAGSLLAQVNEPPGEQDGHLGMIFAAADHALDKGLELLLLASVAAVVDFITAAALIALAHDLGDLAPDLAVQRHCAGTRGRRCVHARDSREWL